MHKQDKTADVMQARILGQHAAESLHGDALIIAITQYAAKLAREAGLPDNSDEFHAFVSGFIIRITQGV